MTLKELLDRMATQPGTALGLASEVAAIVDLFTGGGKRRRAAVALYAMVDRLQRADLVILQFPLWWHAQPAMLKGWFDRVFVYGELYTGSRRYDRGVFRGKRAICSVTTGGPQSTFSQFGRGGTIERLLWPINYSLYYMGFDVLAPSVRHGIQGGGIAYQGQSQFATHLEACKQAWRSRLDTLSDDAAIPFTGWNDWDEAGLPRPGAPVDGALRFRTGQALQ